MKKPSELVDDWSLVQSITKPLIIHSFLWGVSLGELGGQCWENIHLIYFTCNGVQEMLDKAINAGTKLLIPVNQISEDNGLLAAILDSESNRIAIHSKNSYLN